MTFFAILIGLQVGPVSDARADDPPLGRGQSRLYLRLRFSGGYAHYNYSGAAESTGGTTIRYLPATAGGFMLGFGASAGWRVLPNLALGGALYFDPLVAPRGTGADGSALNAEPLMMPNGTAGAMVAWEPTHWFGTELAVTVGGGGVRGLPGGFGLIVHGTMMLALLQVGRVQWGPCLRASVGPVMTDPLRGGDVRYFSVDAGLTPSLGP